MYQTRVLWCAMMGFVVAVGFTVGLRADEPSDDLVKMVAELLADPDPDMRNLALEQVRGEAKGEAATKQFAGLLPSLPPKTQAALIDALAERGDKAARPAVVSLLDSREEPVRTAAVRALGPLGEAADVPRLAGFLSTAGPEQSAAAASLTRLAGDGVHPAIVAELRRAAPAVKAQLVGVLSARGSPESVTVLLEAASDADAQVRIAALTGLRDLAGPEQTAALVGLLKTAGEGDEQRKAEQALLAVCTRGREACVEPIAAGLGDAGPAATTALLRCVARSGGARALTAIVTATKDERPEVVREAVRLLASWPDRAAAPHLLAIARQPASAAQGVVAVQGLIRVASPIREMVDVGQFVVRREADLPLLAEAIGLAKRPEEKRMALGVLQGIASPEALAMAAAAIDDPALTNEASLAVIAIAGKLTDPAGQAPRRAALKKARDKAGDPQIRDKAEAALKALGSP